MKMKTALLAGICLAATGMPLHAQQNHTTGGQHAAAAPAGPETPTTAARLKGLDGADHGTVTFIQAPSGVLIVKLDLKGLPAGVHGFHVHAKGQCDAANKFDSAGGHLAGGRSHGVLNENGPHPGDFPNITAAADGTVKVEFFANMLTLADGDNPLMDDDGSSVMIHEGPDDYKTDPAGHSGGRIACGALEQAA